jgi:hypothetical protein
MDFPSVYFLHVSTLKLEGLKAEAEALKAYNFGFLTNHIQQ